MANARKYGRKLENFDNVYKSITNTYNKLGKSNKELEAIMKEKLPSYQLDYEPIEEDELKDKIKDGIKCLATFDLTNLEWHNFCEYFRDTSKKNNKKVLTPQILKQPNDEVKDPNELEGHSVILSDLDKNGNYIFRNSWGKEWGNEGTFTTKNDCLKNAEYYAIYYDEKELTPEEIKCWKKLKKDIKEILSNMKSIRCPKCKRSARIEQFEIIKEKVSKCTLQCPYEEECQFEIGRNLEDNFEFLVDQLLSYDLENNKEAKNKFIFGF